MGSVLDMLERRCTRGPSATAAAGGRSARSQPNTSGSGGPNRSESARNRLHQQQQPTSKGDKKGAAIKGREQKSSSANRIKTENSCDTASSLSASSSDVLNSVADSGLGSERGAETSGVPLPSLPPAFNGLNLKQIPIKNAVMMLNEMFPPPKAPQYKVTSQTGPPNNPTFSMVCTIEDQNFTGEGKSKKEAKLSCSQKAIEAICGAAAITETKYVPEPSNPRSSCDLDDWMELEGKNPVSILNELYPGIQYQLLSTSGPSHAPNFVIKASLNDMSAEGSGKSKKDAKLNASKALLVLLHKVGFDPMTGDMMSTQQDNQAVASGHSFADQIGQLVTAKYQALFGSTTYSKRRVMAGVVVTKDFGDVANSGEVVCVSSGTKCINGEQLSLEGCVINDSHAEIVTRRCLMVYLYKQLENICNNQDSIFQPTLNTSAMFHYELKEGIEFHLFITTSPCGDARIFSLHENSNKEKVENGAASAGTASASQTNADAPEEGVANDGGSASCDQVQSIPAEDEPAVDDLKDCSDEKAGGETSAAVAVAASSAADVDGNHSIDGEDATANGECHQDPKSINYCDDEGGVSKNDCVTPNLDMNCNEIEEDIANDGKITENDDDDEGGRSGRQNPLPSSDANLDENDNLVDKETAEGERPEAGSDADTPTKGGLIIPTITITDVDASEEEIAAKREKARERVKQTDSSKGMLRSKIECGMGTVPIGQKVHLQTWDGVMSADRLLTMACSDKILRWNVVGIQGALLTHLVKPVYLSSITVGSKFHPGHMKRALYERIEKHLSDMPAYGRTGFSLNVPKLFATTSPETRQATKAHDYSVNWVVESGQAEIVNGSTGKTINDATSRLSKRSLFERFLNVSQQLMKEPFSRPARYSEVKALAVDYQEAKGQVTAALVKAGCGHWVEKPVEQDQFSL